jgi:hypothetical protein
MSKQGSYAVLTEPEARLAKAGSTGTSHTLTMTVDKTKTPPTATLSDRNLKIKNGDKVIWEFVDTEGNPLGDSSAKVAFHKLSSTPGDPDSNSEISVDISEEVASGNSYEASYSVSLGTTKLTFSRHHVLDDPPTLVIDNMGKPPGTPHPKPHPKPGDRDQDDQEGAERHPWRRHSAS